MFKYKKSASPLLFIANPNLPKRLVINALMNEAVAATFYSAGAKSYIDDSFLDQAGR